MISTYDAFRVSARGWGNPAELDAIGLDWFSVPIMAGISEYNDNFRYLEANDEQSVAYADYSMPGGSTF